MITRLAFILGLLVTPVHAQTTLRGKVVDAHDKAVPGANILLHGTYDGASTDSSGSFTFTSDEQGTKTLVVSAISYQSGEFPVELSGKELTLSITLQEAVTELNAVVITAGSFTAGDEDRRTTFKSLDIATTAGATADIAGALNTLPGTQKVGETGRLFVRGGDDNETRTFIDGMVVLDAYSPSAPNTPSRGRFLPFMFKGTSFSTGGYSAEYGQALSSALTLDSKDEDDATRTDIGILSVGGDVSHAQAWENGSAAAKIQYTNLRPYMGLIHQQLDWIAPPLSVEASGAVRQRFGDRAILKFYGNASESNFSLYQHAVASPSKYALGVTNRYHYGNLSYQGLLGNGWSVRTGVSYNTSEYNNELETSSLVEQGRSLHVKSVFEKSAKVVTLKSGAEMIDRNYAADWVNEQQGTLTQSFHEPLAAGFAEADIAASRNFVARAGIRGEYNGLTHNAAIDPRLSVARKLGQGQLSFAYGRFRQSPQTQWLRVNNALHAEKAEHWMLNYQLITNNRTFRAEVYYKRYTDLVKFASPVVTPPPAFSPVTTPLNNAGNGYAQGAELFWRDNRTFRNVDYWISYSYLDTRRDYLNYPEAAMPSFASAHNFSVVYKHFVPRLKTQIGVTYSFASARPYHDPNQSGFMQGRTPNYSDLSANLSYLPTSWIIVHFSCTNLLGYDNIFGYNYAVAPDARGVYAGRAVRQPAPRFLFLAVFITISKNKSINQLPSL